MIESLAVVKGVVAQLSLRDRRQALFELHSFLRSVDNLRPDEAFDEITKLCELWAATDSFEQGAARGAGLESSALSEEAFAGAAERLQALLAHNAPGETADLFQELVDVGVRVGMGQYFTPPPVAEGMVEFLQPRAGESWLDPFCGSALLLGLVAQRAPGAVRLYGIDRDRRALRVAALEASLHHPESHLELLQVNALGAVRELLDPLGAPTEGVDGIVTNPPFGAEVHPQDRTLYSDFELAGEKATPLELLGLEQSIRLLRPGGRLGIVLPQSILSNRSHRSVRTLLLRTCSVDGVLSLPGDTFLPFRGVSKASVLFLTKRKQVTTSRVRLGIARSVGWDATGRTNGGSDVHAVARQMRDAGFGSSMIGSAPDDADLARNLTAEWLLRPVIPGRKLGDLVEAIFTGRTPARPAYELNGAAPKQTFRMLKVGDLTGHGVDWSVGERSIAKLARPPLNKLVRLNDVVTTAAAHHPRYIGAKADIVDAFPPGFEARCLPVAEVMVLRPDPSQIDPYVLLLWLRSNHGRTSTRSCVTGQTAHLNPEDLAEVIVPERLFSADADVAVTSLKQSLRLRRKAEEEARQATAAFLEALGNDVA